LTNSAVKNGWSLLKIKCEWRGFSTKLIETYNHLKNNPEITEFVFCDAYDVIVFGSPQEFKDKIFANEAFLLSAERGLWPPSMIPFRCEYANNDSRFNYINSGLYYAQSKYFIEMFEKYPPFWEIDDQLWLNMVFLLDTKDEMSNSNFRVDYNQKVFNSHSFIDEGEYTYNNNRVQIMGNEPCFLHKNGNTIDEKLNKMLEGMGL
jgi:hypothetical protein